MNMLLKINNCHSLNDRNEHNRRSPAIVPNNIFLPKVRSNCDVFIYFIYSQ